MVCFTSKDLSNILNANAYLKASLSLSLAGYRHLWTAILIAEGSNARDENMASSDMTRAAVAISDC